MKSSILTVEEAKELVVTNTDVLEATEVTLDQALGLVLAEDIYSPVNLPLFTNSAVDGYALKSEDIISAGQAGPVELKVVATIRAGDFPDFSLHSGEAAKIMTGAPVPQGADSVVMIEHTEDLKGTVRIKKEASADENLRFVGEEIQKDKTAIERGVEINPAGLGFMSEMGIKKIKVHRKPRLSVLVSGEELVGPGRRPCSRKD